MQVALFEHCVVLLSGVQNRDMQTVCKCNFLQQPLLSENTFQSPERVSWEFVVLEEEPFQGG